jgi:transcriptional regulator with GAF, ATPase, and Fis domain
LKYRKGDIPLLDNDFMEKYNRLDNRNVKGLTEAASELLVGMAWKGNVRELENVLERAILKCKGDFTGEKDLMIQEKSREVVDKAPTLVPTTS